MVACQIPGHADSYGLGIRISFYLQWFGMIITCWFLESDALNLKFLNGLTILATSIALALNLEVLQPVEIYVVLLLLCGTLYFLVPIYLWRLLTCCHPWWDPERWNKMKVGWLFKTAMAVMSGILLGFQIWFWGTGVYTRPSGTDKSCQQYGFLFGQIPLDSSALTVINIIIHIVMLTMGTWLFCEWIGMFDECRWWRRRKKRKWRITQGRIETLQQFRTVSDFLVAATLTMAIELVISWNNIGGVSNLDTAVQLILPIISGAYFLRSLYVWMFESPQEVSHYIDFPYWGDDYTSYTVPSYGGYTPIRRRTVNIVPSGERASRSRHPRRHRRHQRNLHVDYDAGRPEMSTAYGRYVPDGDHAAENIFQPDPVY